MDQDKELSEFLDLIVDVSRDVLIYTGYEYQEIQKKDLGILKRAAVLITGPYIQERNNGAILRGSDNQEIHVLRSEYQELYNNYLKSTENALQNFETASGVVGVGVG